MLDGLDAAKLDEQLRHALILAAMLAARVFRTQKRQPVRRTGVLRTLTDCLRTRKRWIAFTASGICYSRSLSTSVTTLRTRNRRTRLLQNHTAQLLRSICGGVVITREHHRANWLWACRRSRTSTLAAAHAIMAARGGSCLVSRRCSGRFATRSCVTAGVAAQFDRRTTMS